VQISRYAWFNGKLVPPERANPSVASNTLHLGIAVFDGIMAYWNRDHWYVHCMADHLRRFCEGAERMDLGTKWGPRELGDGIGELLETLPRATHYIRPLAYRTAPETFFQVDVESSSMCVFATPVERDADGPYSCQMSSRQRVHHRAIPATWKVSGAYANSYLAEREARAAGFDTGLMLDVDGRIAEASSSNVFFVSGGTLVTPCLSGDVFAGITRALLVDVAGEHGIATIERNILPRELPAFEAAFICSTLSELRAVDRIGNVVLDSTRHLLVRRITAMFREITHQ
jgi:branched-chain amino acid aminotransferase